MKKEYYNRFTARRKATQRGNRFMIGFFFGMMILIMVVYFLTPSNL